MKVNVDLVIVMPIGPNCLQENICDTVESIVMFIRCDYRLIFADDSHASMGKRLQAIYPESHVVETSRAMGKLGGLYLTLSMAFSFALKHFHFKALLRMDTDALVIGPEPEQAAFKLFDSRPKVGIAGQYPLDYEGHPWDNSWPGKQLYAFTHTRQFFYKPLVHLSLLYFYLKARKNNYQRGESVFGGACFYNEAVLIKLKRHGLLPRKILSRVNLEEDHLFSLLARSLGFELGGLAGSGLPMGCAWKGLPASPEQLLAAGKKIVHSTRFWEGLDEQEIRRQFREARTNNYLENFNA